MTVAPSELLALDYAVRYSVVLTSADDFMTPIREQLHALGYSPPGLGYGGVLPSLTFVFKEPSSAQQVFDIFRKWAAAPADGAAIGLSLVTLVKGDYALCVYPDKDHLQARLAPGVLSSHLQVYTVSAAHVKMFPGPSQNLPIFQTAAAGKPVTILPGLVDGSLAPSLAVPGVPIRFFHEADLSPSDYEYVLLEKGPPPEAPATVDDRRPGVLAQRRGEILSRYFPVTLERLRFDPAFQEAIQQLESEGYARWQVQQAACNLTLPRRLEHLSEDDRGAVGLLMALERDPEHITQDRPAWDLDRLRSQIMEDVAELTSWLTPELRSATFIERQAWLRHRGDLEENA